MSAPSASWGTSARGRALQTQGEMPTDDEDPQGQQLEGVGLLQGVGLDLQGQHHRDAGQVHGEHGRDKAEGARERAPHGIVVGLMGWKVRSHLRGSVDRPMERWKWQMIHLDRRPCIRALHLLHDQCGVRPCQFCYMRAGQFWSVFRHHALERQVFMLFGNSADLCSAIFQ